MDYCQSNAYIKRIWHAVWNVCDILIMNLLSMHAPFCFISNVFFFISGSLLTTAFLIPALSAAYVVLNISRLISNSECYENIFKNIFMDIV